MDRRLLCVRPMCGSVAHAALHYDYADSTVWLEPLGAELAIGAWSVCASHADGLRVPSGWKLVDRRLRNAPGGPSSEEDAPATLSYSPPLAV